MLFRDTSFPTPQPQKRPCSSWQRFEADQPNERWQADTTHWQLANGTPVEILNILDDHERLDVASDAYLSHPCARRAHQLPQRVPQARHTCQCAHDNGAIFTAIPRGDGRVALEIELSLLRVKISHSRAYHPQICGKVERFHQTQKKWLAAQPPAASLHEPQRRLDRFRDCYNTVRSHRSLGRKTPAEVYTARPGQSPPDQ